MAFHRSIEGSIWERGQVSGIRDCHSQDSTEAVLGFMASLESFQLDVPYAQVLLNMSSLLPRLEVTSRTEQPQHSDIRALDHASALP